MLKVKFSVVIAISLLVGCANSNSMQSTYDKPRIKQNFADYVEFLKAKASKQGIAKSVLNTQNDILYIQKALDLDHQQAGQRRKRAVGQTIISNSRGLTRYLKRVLTLSKLNLAERYYWEQFTKLEQASQRFGVQKEYLMALWGMESSFGYYQGNFDVLSVLATLAFDGRREEFFSKEFIVAMKMLQQGGIQRSKMLGSWAGAMGQTQFMPSSYLRYAQDGDKDGEKDIWKNHYDVFASIANYLHTVGWNDKLPWGVEVELMQNLDSSLLGIEAHKVRSLKDWQKQGIVLKSDGIENQQELTALSQAQLWLVRPDRELGRAFLVTNNFRTLLDWNRSNYFAISIGMFADQIKQRVGL